MNAEQKGYLGRVRAARAEYYRMDDLTEDTLTLALAWAAAWYEARLLRRQALEQRDRAERVESAPGE